MLTEILSHPEWVKVPTHTFLTFVGRETLFFAKNCHFVFISLVNLKEKIHYYAIGVECYAGHKVLSLFAFAERCLNPQIIIVNYPDLHHVAVLKNGAPEGYTALCFSYHDYLISLSDAPEYEITVWNWRTTEKMISVNTEIKMPHQILTCSIHSPISVIQYYNEAPIFFLWDFRYAYNKCLYIKRKIKMPNKDTIVGCEWNAEGTCFILNNVGCIYTMTSDYKLEIIIYGGIEFGIRKPCFTWFRGGFVVHNTFSDVKYFKRSGDWKELWNVEQCELLQLISNSVKDYLIGWSVNGEILLFNNSSKSFVVKKLYKSPTSHFCFIYPLCDYFVAVSQDAASFIIWKILPEEKVTVFHILDEITTIASNPIYPYIAVGLDSGIMRLISVYQPAEPKHLTYFSLYNKQITKILFNPTGDLIAVANLEEGFFFIIKGLPGETMNIINFINYRRPTIDICITEDEKHINLFMLVKTHKLLPISQRIVVKMFSKSTNKLKKKKFIANNFWLCSLHLTDNGFITKIFNSKNIAILTLKKNTITIKTEIPSGHTLRKFSLHCDNRHIYTFGCDGLIIIRNLALTEIFGALLPHHRFNSGVRNAIIDPYMRYVISYGFLEDAICSVLAKSEHTGELFEFVRCMCDIKKTLTENIPTIGFEIDEEDEPQYRSYVEFKKLEKLREEEIIHKSERESIMNEFLILQREVRQLLNENMNAPELFRIDILDFYQHTSLMKHKEELNEKKCEWTVKYYNDLIRAQNIVWNLIKVMCWDSMDIKEEFIYGMFTCIIIESYSKLPDVSVNIQEAKYANMYREIEEMLRDGDLVRLWVPVEECKLMLALNVPPQIRQKSEAARMKEFLEDLGSSSSSSGSTNVEITEPYPSTNIGQFIVPTKLLYDQDELHTYAQVKFQLKLYLNDHDQLRTLFNKAFEEVRQYKIREMGSIFEKTKRLRHIVSELTYFKFNSANIQILDPQWHAKEDIYSLFVVKDSELTVTRYISPSEQAILDWQAAEAERIRLLLLADDFREKALIKMMDGVLEVRWEDTLKRIIPKPRCLTDKDPMLYNEEDLRAIRDYDEKVAFLKSERLMYKNILETEYAKTADTVRDMIKKFNSKIHDLYLLRIRMEKARCQQQFIIQYSQCITIKSLRMKEERDRYFAKIDRTKLELQEITQQIQQLEKSYDECKVFSETYLLKEKQLEKNFKKDIQEFSVLAQEQSVLLYKKLPRTNIKNINTISLLNLLGACCVSQQSSPLLSFECLEYLKSLDHLDSYEGIPTNIDETHYRIICKHRRLKIENDLKIKANAMEQLELEQAIQSFQNYLAYKKNLLVEYANHIAKCRQNHLEFVHDKKIQIIMNKGIVELKLNGRIRDFDNAILIPRVDVEVINKHILTAGDKKLKAMRRKMLHRRKILMMEWEHRSMKMRIEDLGNFIYLIEHTKLTKEVQLYLKQKAKQKPFEMSLDEEIESKKASYENILKERFYLIRELDKQIVCFRNKNKVVDQQIFEVNVDLCERRVLQDLEFQKKYKEDTQKRMEAIIQRSKLVKQIQEQHNEILILQAELELLKLKAYPNLHFKTLS